jgi:hypothetical protein
MYIFRIFCFALCAFLVHEAQGAVSSNHEFELRDGDKVVFIGNTFIERDRHYGYIETALTVRYPGKRIQFRNMAWPGDTVDIQLRPLNFGELREHLERYRPTVALLSYGLNEAFEGPGKVEEFIEGYRRILDILTELEVREVVLIGPNPHEAKGDPFPDPSDHNRNLAPYSKAIRDLASERGGRFVDLFEALGRGEKQSAPYTENGIHLNGYGYRLAAREIDRTLHSNREPWSIDIEAGEGAVNEPTGAEVENLETAPSSVSFTATSDSLPPPAMGEIETPGGGIRLGSQGAPDRRLSVHRLAPGEYELLVDGERIAKGDTNDLESGLPWATGPEYARFEEARQSVLKKNEYFCYRWRAHNGEYIYGRRSKSSGDEYGSGNAGNDQFPEEMAEFERLIAEEEERIFELAKPEKHRYELRKVEGSN